VEHHHAADDKRREGVRSEHRHERRAGLLPNLLAVGRIERGDDARHADRIEAPAKEHRRRLRPGAVTHRGTVHGERGRVRGLPQHAAALGVERAHRLVVVLPCEQVDAIPHDERRGITEADFDLPLADQLLRPLAWWRERREHAVAVRAAPLRPIGRWPLCAGERGQPGHERDKNQKATHGDVLGEKGHVVYLTRTS
jgi:hypothetical protein